MMKTGSMVILRLPEVKRRTGLGKTAIYAGMKDKSFPLSVQISKHAVGWMEHEIDAWVEARFMARGRSSNDDHAQAAA